LLLELNLQELVRLIRQQLAVLQVLLDEQRARRSVTRMAVLGSADW
jgi:hypothetical protein